MRVILINDNKQHVKYVVPVDKVHYISAYYDKNAKEIWVNLMPDANGSVSAYFPVEWVESEAQGHRLADMIQYRMGIYIRDIALDCFSVNGEVEHILDDYKEIQMAKENENKTDE